MATVALQKGYKDLMAMLLAAAAAAADERPHALPVPRPQSSRAALCCPLLALQPATPCQPGLARFPAFSHLHIAVPPCTPFRPPKDPPVRVFAFVRPSPSCQGCTPGQRNSLPAKTCRSKPFCPGPDASWLPPATGPTHAEHPLPCLCLTCLFGRGGQASPSVVAISQPIVIKRLVFSRRIVLLHCPFAPAHQSGSSILDGQTSPSTIDSPHAPLSLLAWSGVYLTGLLPKLTWTHSLFCPALRV